MFKQLFTAIVLVSITQSVYGYDYIQQHYDRLDRITRETQQQEQLYLQREQVRIQQRMLDQQRLYAPKTNIFGR